MARLAIDGGEPVRKAPFPTRSPFGPEEIDLLSQAVRSQNLFGPAGTMVPAFEKAFAELYGLRHAAASSSGTAAIHVALGAADLEPGDEVITAPITDAGTIVPILFQNAVPVFADIDETYNMDPADVERQITRRTRAILVVHLFGNPCDMDAMADVAARHKLLLIEDCSQAHLTTYKGRLLGTFGDMAAWSFQQSKHMTTGDGGMTACRRDEPADRMSLFRDKGWPRRAGAPARTYELLGLNYRMTELQAAVGLAQLKKVRRVVDRRHELGERLTAALAGCPGVAPAPVTPGGRHTYWLYPLRLEAPRAADFAKALCAEGVPASAGYTGEPIYLCMDALAKRKTFGRSGHPLDGCHGGRKIDYTRGLCPRTEQALAHMVCLWPNENYTDADIDDLAAAVRKVAGDPHG